MEELGISYEDIHNNMSNRSYSLWYVPPEQTILDDMYRCARDIWMTYDDTYGYASEKVEHLGNMNKNPRDYMLAWTMFDSTNQNKFAAALQPASKDYLTRAVMGEE